MLRYAISDLRRRGTRLLLTLAGIAVATCGLVAVSELAGGLKRAWHAGLAEAESHLIAHEGAALNVFNGSLPLAPLTRLRDLPGVRAVDPVVTKLIAVGADQHHALVVGLEADSRRWASLRLLAGRLPRPGERWVAILGAQFAASTGLDVGQRVELLFQDFEVIGIARHRSALNDNSALVPLEDLTTLTYSPDRVTFFAFRLAAPQDPAAVAQVRAAAAELVPGSLVQPVADMLAQNDVLALFDALSWSVSAVAIGVGALLVAGTLMILVADRRRELAVLLCVGWSSARMFATVLLQGLLLTALGGLLGAAMGAGVTALVAAHPLASGMMEPGFDPLRVALALGGTLLMGLAGAWLPALQAARIEPAVVLTRA